MFFLVKVFSKNAVDLPTPLIKEVVLHLERACRNRSLAYILDPKVVSNLDLLFVTFKEQ